MKRLLCSLAIVLLAACGGSNTAPAKKLDPEMLVRVRDLFDTTTVNGRAHWHVYMTLTSPDAGKEGLSPVGNFDMGTRRYAAANNGLQSFRCIRVGSDSLGNRFMSLLAVADTTVGDALTPDSTARNIAVAWGAGSRSLPPGYKAIFLAPVDAWDSEQFKQGHGLTYTDPVRWSWDMAGAGTATFYEMTPADTAGCGSY